MSILAEAVCSPNSKQRNQMVLKLFLNSSDGTIFAWYPLVEHHLFVKVHFGHQMAPEAKKQGGRGSTQSTTDISNIGPVWVM